jgi:hypothetical protein
LDKKENLHFSMKISNQSSKNSCEIDRAKKITHTKRKKISPHGKIARVAWRFAFVALVDVRSRIQRAVGDLNLGHLLVAVSELHSASDILTCHQHGQPDCGENQVQELEDKSQLAFRRVQQSQDAGMYILSIFYLASSAHSHSAIPNLHAVHTLTSLKTATTLDKSMPAERSTPLNVLLQVNTSGEDSKSGFPPLRRMTTDGSGTRTAGAADSHLVALASQRSYPAPLPGGVIITIPAHPKTHLHAAAASHFLLFVSS